jgi:hypothetical protein
MFRVTAVNARTDEMATLSFKRSNRRAIPRMDEEHLLCLQPDLQQKRQRPEAAHRLPHRQPFPAAPQNSM